MNLFADTIEKPISDLATFAANHHGPFFVSYEVFAIKVSLNKNGSLSYSTKGKENAFESFWSEHRSFGNLFLDEWRAIGKHEEFFAAIKPGLDYYFLVPLRKTNRVLLTPAEEEKMAPVVFLSSVYEHGGEATLLTKEFHEKFQGPWSFLPEIDPSEYSAAKFPGSVGVSFMKLNGSCPEFPREGGSPRLIRFIQKVYLDYKALRDNAPDIYVRYGQLWKEHSPGIEYFRAHYREQLEKFDRSVNEIFEEYQTRYIAKEFRVVSPLRHAVLKKIREIHLRNRWEFISKNNVFNIIFKFFSQKMHKL